MITATNGGPVHGVDRRLEVCSMLWNALHRSRLHPPRNPASVSAAFVALSAVCWGLAGGIGGMLMAEGWDPIMVSFYRGAVGFLFVLVWLALRPGGSGMASRRLWFWSAIAGFGVAGNFAFYLLSISNSSVSVAAMLMYCAPVFVFLVSFALRLEKPTPLKCVSIAAVMLGVVLLTRSYEVGGGAVTPLGIGAGLLSGLSYAVFIFGFKYAARHGSPRAILVIAFAALVVVLGWLGDPDQAVAALRSRSLPLFILLGVLGAGVSFIFYIVGLRNTAPAVASIVAMVEPLTASLFSVLFLNESLVGPQLLGMGIILVTVSALSVSSSAQ
ncbi:MAG: EamA family transporter [Chromatocurvus sp.]